MPSPPGSSSTPRSYYSREGTVVGESANRGHCTQTVMSSNLSHTLRTVSFYCARLHHLKQLFFLVLFGPFAEAGTRDFYENDDEFAEEYGYSSDSDLEEDSDFESLPIVGTENTSFPRQREAPYGQYEEHMQAGKVIRVQDIAFIT